MVEYCEACDTRVTPMWDHNKLESVYHTTSDGKGPYCDKCWYWQKQIEEIKELLNESTGR